MLEGRYERAFNEQPPTQQRLEIDGYAFDRFAGGKVVEFKLFIDVSSLSQRAALATQAK